MELVVCFMFSNNTFNDLALETFLSPLYDKKKEEDFFSIL